MLSIYFYLTPVKYLTTMAFKEFGILLQGPFQQFGGYGETHKIIINENDIYSVRFQPSQQGPHINPRIVYSPNQCLHGICGQEIGDRTLVYHSERPFRIEDLAHTIQSLSRISFWSSTEAVLSTRGPGLSILDDYIEEVKYRQAKNDHIENVTLERDTFAKRLFEVTEELSFLNQVVDTPVLVAEEIPDVSDLKAHIQSLKLQLATEKRISQKYARDLQEKDKQQSVLTAM
jgi:hypothetical protein